MVEKPHAFLNLVRMLESSVGHKTKYSALEPFACAVLANAQPSVIEIQRAGRRISEHMGLTDLVFVISVTDQPPSVAGHIELDRSSASVFVEISRDICAFNDAVLATLCHELSHKYLHVHGIRNGTVPVEQEYLTDVAAVYLGMGKIMLNGCESVMSQREQNGSTITTTTTTLKTGYISRECFAFVYRVVSEMRRIPPHEYLKGLSVSALEAVSQVEKAYASWLRADYHTPEGIGQLTDRLNKRIAEAQTRAADLDRNLRSVESAVAESRTSIRDAHLSLSRAQKQIERLREPGPNPHLRYLDCLDVRELVGMLATLTDGQFSEVDSQWAKVPGSLPESRLAEPTVIVECPIDGRKLRLPGGKMRLLVTCASCRYKFIASTAEPARVPSAADAHQKSGFLKSLKAAFGRH